MRWFSSRIAVPVTAVICVAVACVVGCASEGPVSLPPTDAGAMPSGDASVLLGDASSSFDAGARFDAGAVLPTIFREDFSSREHVETASVAIQDVNRGVVTLPAAAFRALPTGSDLTVVEVTSATGPVSAESVVVPEGADVDARDGLDLRARDTVRIVGRVRAGPGGVTITAGEAIFIDGTIDSEGPIHFEVPSPTGIVSVSGLARGWAGVRVITRGGVDVTGGVVAWRGDVSVVSYGPVTVRGPEARVETATDALDAIHLHSENKLGIRDGAGLLGASVLIEAESLQLAAATVRGRIAVELESNGGLELDGARLETLSDGSAGDVLVSARTATLSGETQLLGGSGARAGNVALSIREALRMESGLRIRAGDGTCAQGGSVDVDVAGQVVGVGLGGELRGGDSLRRNGVCQAMDGGGASLVAWRVRIPPEWVVAGGDGRATGPASVREDPRLVLPPVQVKTSVTGYLISRPIDRGPNSVGYLPELVVARAVTPDGTFARIQFAPADEREPTWVDLEQNTGLAAERLAAARFVRYRVYLKGLSLDAPEVDYFDVRLAP